VYLRDQPSDVISTETARIIPPLPNPSPGVSQMMRMIRATIINVLSSPFIEGEVW